MSDPNNPFDRPPPPFDPDPPPTIGQDDPSMHGDPPPEPPGFLDNEPHDPNEFGGGRDIEIEPPAEAVP